MIRAILAFALMTGTAFAAVEPGWTLTVDGLGPIDIGIRADKLKAVLGTPLPYQPTLNNGCGAFTTKQMAPHGVSFLVESSVLTRISIDFYGTDPRPLEIKTAAGIGLRSTEEDLLKAYPGQARVVPNAGDPNWHTVFVDSPNRNRALAFETDGKTVKSMRIGEYPAVLTNTGCE